MEPTTTTATSLIMPSPTQFLVGGIFLGIGLTAGYYFASMTAEAVDAGLEKTGIKDRVSRLMSSKKKKKHAEEDVEAEIEDELEDEEVEEDEKEALNPKARKSLVQALLTQAKISKMRFDVKRFRQWAGANAAGINRVFSLQKVKTTKARKEMVQKGTKLQESLLRAKVLRPIAA